MSEIPLIGGSAPELIRGSGDPVVMYLIVRESLGMSPGKAAAQCAHAAQMLQLHFGRLVDAARGHDGPDSEFFVNVDQPTADMVDRYRDWLGSSFRKVVLRADDKEWVKLKGHPGLDFVVVRDAGLTEVDPGSETVIGLWPMLRSGVPPLVRRLQALK